LSGPSVYHRRQWRRRGWLRDWTEAAIPTFALGAANLARQLSRMSTDRWIAVVLFSGAVAGAVLALVTGGLRRVLRAAGVKGLDSDRDTLKG
jgi:hypothetical protein